MHALGLYHILPCFGSVDLGERGGGRGRREERRRGERKEGEERKEGDRRGRGQARAEGG